MKSRLLAVAGAAILLSSAAAARADVLYNNPVDTGPNANGDCSWNSVCGPEVDGYQAIAAEAFSLSATDSLTSATFTEYDDGTQPSLISWSLYDAATDGSVGTLITSGSSTITSTTDVGSNFGLTLTQNAFDLSGVTLGAGDYYLGLSATTDDFANYLADGVATLGAYQSVDGGATFQSGYGDGLASLAVSITGDAVSAAPEPATWALMFAGVAMIGGMLRFSRRRGQMAAAFA